MDYRSIFTLEKHSLRIEALDGALLCGGAVYAWRHEYVDAGSQILIPDGCYVMTGPCKARLVSSSTEYRFATPGDRLDIIQVLDSGLDCRRYICLGEGDAVAWRSLEDMLIWREENGEVCVTGCQPGAVIAIPREIGGLPVTRAELGPDTLTELCRELIISDGVRELRLDFSAAPGLERLDFPVSARLLSSPLAHERTNWFRRQRRPVYLGGWYLGTPGGTASLGSDELVIRPGTVAIADGADFKCPWRSITLPDSLRHIGRLAFADARALESLLLPDGPLTVGEYAFEQRPKLPELRLPR
jgi:hypothetical protein